MEKDQIGYKIFDYIRNRRAVTRKEITVEFGLPSNYVGKSNYVIFKYNLEEELKEPVYREYPN